MPQIPKPTSIPPAVMTPENDLRRSAVMSIIKTQVENALTKTGASYTFTWSDATPFGIGDFINDEDVQQLRNALNVAYDALNLGCTHCTADKINNSGYDGDYGDT